MFLREPPSPQPLLPDGGLPVPRVEPAKVAERGLASFLPVPVQQEGCHPLAAAGRCIERGSGALQHHRSCPFRQAFILQRGVRHRCIGGSRCPFNPPGPECRCLGVRVAPRHQVGPAEVLPEIIEPLMKRPAGLPDVHQEVFAGRADAVQPGLVRDLMKRMLVGIERDPRGPGEGAPVVEEGGDLFGIEGVFWIGRHLLYRIGRGGG